MGPRLRGDDGFKSAAAIQNTSPSDSSVSSQSSGNCGERGFKQFAATADFAQQPAMRRQVVARFIQNASHDIEPICAAVERQLRLEPAFARQRGHAFGIHIGWIADDQVVHVTAERFEQIAPVQ